MFDKIKRALNFDNVAEQQQKQAEIERILAERGKDAVELSDDPNDNVFSFDSSNPAITELTDISTSVDGNESAVQVSTSEPVIDVYTSTEVVGWPDRQTQFYHYGIVQRYIPHGDSILEFGAGRGDFNQWYQTTYQSEQEYLGYEVQEELVEAGGVAYENRVNLRNDNWMNIRKRDVKDWCINIGACNRIYDETITDNTQYLKDTIDKMMSHCNKGSVIMFQSDYQTDLPDGFIGYNAGEILSWVIGKYNLAALDHSAGDGQCYLVIYKTA